MDFFAKIANNLKAFNYFHEKSTIYLFNPFMHNVVKWPNIMHERVYRIRILNTVLSIYHMWWEYATNPFQPSTAFHLKFENFRSSPSEMFSGKSHFSMRVLL